MIERVSESSEPGKCHYLPHHPVIREDKDTTKVRIVFDVRLKVMDVVFTNVFITQPAITYSKLTIETLEQGVKYVQS